MTEGVRAVGDLADRLRVAYIDGQHALVHQTALLALASLLDAASMTTDERVADAASTFTTQIGDQP